MSDRPDHEPTNPDLWLALASGHTVWAEGVETPGPRERVAAAGAFVGALACAGLAWIGMRIETRRWPWTVREDGDVRIAVAALLVVAAAGVLAVWYVRTAFGRPIVPTSFWPSVAWRGTCFTIVLVGLAVLFPQGQVAVGIAVGLMCGADVGLTLWALGTSPRPARLAVSFLLSPVHLGAVGAGLAVLVTGTGPDFDALVGIYGGVLAAVATALFVFTLLESLALHFEQEYEAHRLDVAARERAHRAHWLHDDVLSEVRLASLRITHGSASPEQVKQELIDLDHRLRLRQLDEMIRGGNPPVYEVLQPHLRRLQNLGVTLDSVPTHEVTRIRLNEEEANLLNRILSLLTSNAVNAGASRVSVGIWAPPDTLEIDVVDDAGGFDFDAIPPGRGLHRLMTDLGPGSVRRTDVPGGSRVHVRMPRRTGPAIMPPADHRVPRPVGRVL